MSTIQYPAPVTVTNSDTHAIVELLKKHVEETITPADIQRFFESRAAAQFPTLPRHPQAAGHSYGHWGLTDGVQILAHQTHSRLDIHAVAGQSFLIAAPGYNGAVWADYDPATGAVGYTALGMADHAFAGFAYRPGDAAKTAIDHQITHHVTKRCSHDHALPAANP